jgi:hypothetical protein
MEPRQHEKKIGERRPDEKKKRFRIVKLEERIAPQTGGGSNNPHPCGGRSVFLCSNCCKLTSN